MTTPLYKRSATEIISDFQFPISDFVGAQKIEFPNQSAIGNRQSAMLPVADGLPFKPSVFALR